MAKYTKYFDNCLAVFQGGGCKVIADIGAYEEACRRGIVMNEFAGTSAGAIIAAFVAANATTDQLKAFVEKFSKKSKNLLIPPKRTCKDKLAKVIIRCFIKKQISKDDLKVFDKFARNLSFTTLSEHLGLYDMQPLHDFIEAELQAVLGINREVYFSDIPKPLHIVATDLSNGDLICWNSDTKEKISVADAICASCAIPGFFYAQGKDGKYVDGGLLSNSPMFVFDEKLNYNKVLNFCFAKKKNVWNNTFEHLLALLGTVVDGAVAIQHQTGIEKCDVIITPPEDIETISFDKLSSENIEKLYQCGAEAMSAFIKKEDDYSPLNRNKDNIIKTYDELYSLIASFPDQDIKEVYVSMHNTQWCWRLFPTLLKWVEKSADIHVFCREKSAIHDADESARHRLLSALGCTVEKLSDDNYPLSGFFLRIKDSWYGIVVIEPQEGNKLQGKYYDHSVDNAAINAFIEKLNNNVKQTYKSATKQITIHKINQQEIVDRLRTLPYYRNANIYYDDSVNIADVKFLNNQIRLEKFRQIDKMFHLYENENLVPFSPALLCFSKKERSIIGPIVLERHDNQLYVIEGNTRLVRAYYKREKHICALIVEGVTESLPIKETTKTFSINQMRVTDCKLRDNNELRERFRHIEATLRPSQEYLTPKDPSLSINL